MEFRQFYLGCLAQASYLIGSEGEAAVVDPRRDVDEYLAAAREGGLRIRYVLETHLHADFVSGHRELSERTGAEIVISRRAGASFPHRAVSDGDTLRIGRVSIRVLETPGHTPESVCYVVTDEAESPDPRLVLTGDTLFIGDVGRPDLVGAKGFTAEQMARMLYASIHDKLLKLDDAVAVYPAHGAGSLCGRNISKETSSTIGAQRRTNPALRPMSADEFVRSITRDQPEVPRYFPLDVEMNRAGAAALGASGPLPRLDPAAARAALTTGAAIIDVRDSSAHALAHVDGSLNVGLGGQFASWAGTLIDASRDLVIVADESVRAEEARMRLSRVGLDRVVGWLGADAAAWRAAELPIASFPTMSVGELAQQRESVRVIDVRRAGEWESGRIPGAIHAPLHELGSRAASLDRRGRTAVVCGSGYRSPIACDVLRAMGFEDVVDVVGGMAAWRQAGLPEIRDLTVVA